MSYLKFEKSELVNLEYSLSREQIRSNRAGAYASTTIIGCNTRKYHGLLVCPLEEMGGEHHVLLSTLDATVVQHDQAFNFGIHKYEGDHYVPRGHKYVRDFDATRSSYLVYRVGGVVLSREILLVSRAEQVLVRYTLLDAHSDTLLRLSPFLAFRKHHALSRSNLYANTRYEEVPNGISSCLYEGYPKLYMQCSKEAEFIPVPDWYYNIEYMEEQKRGYAFKEDLYVPGYFEMPIRKGESLVFSASTSEVNPAGLKRRFSAEEKNRLPLDSFSNCLLNAAQQFVVYRKESTELIAGFPWFGIWGRDTFMALPGLTMVPGELATARAIIDTMIKRMEGGMFPEPARQDRQSYTPADTPLWFIWALQQYESYDPGFDVWKRYGKAIRKVLEAYMTGVPGKVHMMENGLIHAACGEIPATWMDAMVDGMPVTPRRGAPVEINALWYNAVMQGMEWLKGSKDKLLSRLEELAPVIAASFVESFWSNEKGYLADYVDGSYADWAVRPNQVIALSMKYSALDADKMKSVLDVVESELLTDRGLRTLSPKNEVYEGICEGDQATRDRAVHQGTVWPWLLEHFAKGYLKVYKKSGVSLLRRLIDGFEEALTQRGIGSISEVYDGNPPHTPRGGISQASGVAALIRTGEMIDKLTQS